MKKLFIIFTLLTQTLLIAQESIPPETISDFNATVTGIFEGNSLIISMTWTKPFDDSQISKYEFYNNGVFYIGYDCSLFECLNSNTVTFPYLEAGVDNCLTIKTIDEYNNISEVSNEVCINQPIYSQIISDIFISQYYEGENENNAIELSVLHSYMGPSFDASDYSLKINIDGGNSWSAPLQLSGLVEQNNSLVIINSNATDIDLINAADVSTDNIVMQFDGNDPIGLFKNDELVDIIGNFNSGGTVFGSNINLIRDECEVNNKSLVEFEIVYTPSFWRDGFYGCQSDINKGLGAFSFCCLLSGEDLVKDNSIKIYPSPFTDDLNIDLKNKLKAQIEIYSIQGKRKFHKEIFGSELIDLNGLNGGIYILKIKQGNDIVIKKIVKQ